MSAVPYPLRPARRCPVWATINIYARKRNESGTSPIELAVLELGLQTMQLHKYVCITTYQPDTTSNPNRNPNHDPTTKQHATVNIQLNIVTRPTYPDKIIRDNVVAPFVPTSVVSYWTPVPYTCSCASFQLSQFIPRHLETAPTDT